MMRDAARWVDMPLLLNMEMPEEWTRRHREKAEALEKKEPPVRECSEMTIVEKDDKHLITIKLKKEAEERENNQKSKDHKMKALKTFLESQIGEDIDCLRKKVWDGKGTLKRDIRVTYQDTMQISLNIQIEVKRCTDHVSQASQSTGRRPKGNTRTLWIQSLKKILLKHIK